MYVSFENYCNCVIVVSERDKLLGNVAILLDMRGKILKALSFNQIHYWKIYCEPEN